MLICPERNCWLVAGGWFVTREKYSWLVADKSSEQAGPQVSTLHWEVAQLVLMTVRCVRRGCLLFSHVHERLPFFSNMFLSFCAPANMINMHLVLPLKCKDRWCTNYYGWCVENWNHIDRNVSLHSIYISYYISWPHGDIWFEECGGGAKFIRQNTKLSRSFEVNL
jgi:hypothetical protein